MPTAAEPSRVYGYVSLVDPTTGEIHLTLNYDVVPPTTSIALYWLRFVFRGVSDPSLAHDVQIDGGFRQVGDPPKAFLYDVGMRLDRGAAGMPYRISSGMANDILYNPDVWHFDHIVPGNFAGTAKRVSSTGAVTYETVSAPLTQRSTPFEDPDLAPLA